MMAYNSFYNPYMQYQQPYMQQQPQQIQNSGFVSVQSMTEAFNYPVAPGNSITFKDENAPYVYTKTKGFSPLEQPVFEKYRLVKEEEMPREAPKQPETASDCDEQIKLLWDEVNALKGQITALNAKEEKLTRKAVKKEVADE